MSKDLLKKDRNEIVRKAESNLELVRPASKTSPFLSFHYSYQEISCDGDKTHVRSKQKSFENGKLTSEEFDGTLPGSVYNGMIGEMQKLFFNQCATLMNSFSMFLPFQAKKTKE